jgi:subtilisin family serine protease
MGATTLSADVSGNLIIKTSDGHTGAVGPYAPAVKTENSTAVSASTSTYTIDCSQSNNYIITLAADITDLSFTNTPASGNVYKLRLFIVQTDTNYTLTWPTSISWGTLGAPTISITAPATDIIELITYNGGANWYGILYGSGF